LGKILSFYEINFFKGFVGFKFGLGLNIVDSLDTMWIMNLTEEYDEARKWVETSLNFDTGGVSLFEVLTTQFESSTQANQPIYLFILR
jgi:hypothetical protein